jgi:protein CpxP
MKKLIVLALLIVGTTIVAQERNKRPQRFGMEQFTPEQQSQLMLKRMTLELDLTEGQQKEITSFISDKMAKKEAHKANMKAMKEKGVKPTKDERFAMHIKMLDEQIATKKSMQKILNAKQFEKWASLKEDHKGNRQEMLNRNQQGRNPGKRQGNPERKG